MRFEHEVKVGAFVLLSLFLIVFVIMWLHKFDMASHLRISARFISSGTLSKGATVLYRGVKAGTVESITLSPDENYSMVNLNITNKDVNVYDGSTAIILDKGFTGTKVLSIQPPADLSGKKRLKSGDVIEGGDCFTYEDLQSLLAKLSKSGTLEGFVVDSRVLIRNTTLLTDKLDILTSKFNKIITDDNSKELTLLLSNMNELSVNMNYTSIRLNEILKDKNIPGDVRKAVSSTQSAMTSFKNVLDKSSDLVDKSKVAVSDINKTVSNLDETLNNPELKGSVRGSMQKMSDVLDDIREITGDSEVKKNLKGSLIESKESLSSLSCLGYELSSTLSKRFLIPRMTFGSPGKDMKKCFSNRVNSLDSSKNNE
jgi:ABC-type transporter Mla subunit MlaD